MKMRVTLAVARRFTSIVSFNLKSRTGKKRSEVVIDGIMLLSKSLSEN